MERRSISFNVFQWAAFIYWATSFGGNIGGDQDYVEIMQNIPFLEQLRNNPSDLSDEEIQDHLILFLNKWRCHLRRSKTANLRQALVGSLKHMLGLKGANILNLNAISGVDDAILAIYGTFDCFGPTTISKILHMLNPNLFVMWDDPIRKQYSRPGTADGYLAFLHQMQHLGQVVVDDFLRVHPTGTLEAFLGEKLRSPIQKSLAKFIDEYNWIAITKQMPLPPFWWPENSADK